MKVKKWSIIFLICFSFLFYARSINFLNKSEFTEKVNKLISQRVLENAIWGIAVYDLKEKELIYSKNYYKSFMPASNMKIFTSAVALEKLGPDFCFHTDFYIDGKIENGILKGNLIVRGTGDPTISFRYAPNENVMKLMDGIVKSFLKKSKIKKIEGLVIGDDNFFSEKRISGTWENSDLPYWYAAETDGLNFNENVVRMYLKGVHKRKPILKVDPDIGYLSFVNKITCLKEKNSFWDYTRDLNNVVVLFGNIKPGENKKDRVSVHNPTKFFLKALEVSLKNNGVDISRTRFFDIDELPKTLQKIHYENLPLVYSYKSPPLSDIMIILNKKSHNLYADILLKTLGKIYEGEGSFKKGFKVVRQTLLEWGAYPLGFYMEDGSGLSRRDFITPETMIVVLKHMYESDNRDVFIKTLPISGVDGTLKRRFKNRISNKRIFAKTGYINKVRSLSGYAKAYNGKIYAFCIICNNYFTSTKFINNIIDTICDYIVLLKK